ncbi:TetR/AcrR family transcriptional regulator [Myxococcus sp. K15C18031901]|uniref:TetR/AcrR family transcriptional regulator n=1 Tax=Myxococcus dinghuensis TaxID=2906761 RepID=UPI0020A707C6|nr:TetR/AcrR family transcriptional regulator [Myxococcus dinghuensis]MCP3100364.1 TetR/AcrR family transcriptional regulator [Myxococcus dinghuensis]
MRNPGSRKEDVLKAALECFLEAGFEGTTMAAIRARSGASTGSIYHLFESKDAIATALYLEVLEEYHEGALRELQRLPGAKEGVEALVRFHLEWALAHPKQARFLLVARRISAISGSEPGIRDQNRGTFGRLREWLQGHVQAGAIEPMSLDVFLAIVYSPAQELLREWLTGRAKSDPKASISVLSRAAWRGVERGGAPRPGK